MRARYQDSQHPENNTQELELSLDLYICPMTRQIIRHPVLAADGHRYELAYLLQYVRNGGEDSPLRAGTGGIYPVVYDTQWKELLDLLFANNSDLYDQYNPDGMADEINSRLEGNYLSPNEDRVDSDGRPIHVAIGNSVLKMFLYFLIISATVASIARECLPNNLRNNETVSFWFIMTAIPMMTFSLCYHDSRIRIENDNEYGILGGIANRYYSLFKRTPPRQPPEFPLPLHRQDRL